MTIFWCPWCGETAEADRADRRLACARCVREGLHLFHFWTGTLMIPLEPGEQPGEAAAGRKRFVFVDARTGRPRGETAVPPKRVEKAGEGGR